MLAVAGRRLHPAAARRHAADRGGRGGRDAGVSAERARRARASRPSPRPSPRSCRTTGAGAAFAATVDGRPVVDLWGGTRDDDGAPWREDTAACCSRAPRAWWRPRCSCSSIAARSASSSRVAELWPEFAAAGKEARHRRRRARRTRPACRGSPSRWRRRTPSTGRGRSPLLAAQAPLIPVGQASYHARDLRPALRRARAPRRRPLDRAGGGRRGGRAARPRHLDRRARRRAAAARRSCGGPTTSTSRRYLASDPDPRLELVYHNPPLFGMDWNAPEVLQAEIAGRQRRRDRAQRWRASTAAWPCGGSIDGVRLLRPETLARRPPRAQRRRRPAVRPAAALRRRLRAVRARRRSSGRPRTRSATRARAARRTARGPACAPASRS